MSDDIQVYVRLRKLMTERLSDDELNVLCFDIGLDYDDLGGDSKAEKVIELLQDIRRRQQLTRLIDAGKASRPDIEWEVALQVGAPPAASPVPPPPHQLVATPPELATLPAAEPTYVFSPPGAASPLPRRSALDLRDALAAAHQDDVQFYPSIPPDKLGVAAERYRIPPDETVVALVDTTLFRSAKLGIAFGLRGIYYHNDWASKAAGPGALPYSELVRRSPEPADEYEVSLGLGGYVYLAGCPVTPSQMTALLNAAIQLLATT